MDMTIPPQGSELREQFMQSVGNHAGFPFLFAEMDEVAFFMKNAAYQIIFANRAFFGRLGFDREADIIGRDDFELFPTPLAEKFRVDDEYVLRTGAAIPRMIELFLSRQGLPDWFVTYKVAVLDPEGKPVGIMGTVKRYDHAENFPVTHEAVSLAIKAMRAAPGDIDSLRQFAVEAGISYRHFDRLFKASTGLTPKQYLGRSRVQHACERLLQSDASIADIAMALGYCDQSALTSQFRKRMGFTPLKYRKRFHSNDG